MQVRIFFCPFVWFIHSLTIKTMNKDKVEHVYLALKISGKAWCEIEQVYLGRVKWSSAVALARLQSAEVRLSTSRGYANQGHYISPCKTATV